MKQKLRQRLLKMRLVVTMKYKQLLVRIHKAAVALANRIGKQGMSVHHKEQDLVLTLLQLEMSI